MKAHHEQHEDAERSCWRCLSTDEPLTPLGWIQWRRRGEAELRPALVCAKCATKKDAPTSDEHEPVKVDVHDRQLDLWR